tara:strand:- start:1423 stop:1695 length:273 start_codon:yes stop_codon:yes gene_type:complete
MTTDQWLPTPAATAALKCSPSFLKRNRDTAGGFLINGVHWRWGVGHSSPIFWNVPAIQKLLNERGLQQARERNLERKAEKAMAELQGEAS